MAVYTRPVIPSFAIGTWVAASAVVARLAMLAAPSDLWLAKGVWILAVGLWGWFIPRALRNLVQLSSARDVRPNGAILLSTVATQAIALLAFRLYPQLRWSTSPLIALGAACYVAGAFVILRHYATDRGWRLAGDWDNSNCILHGALSITGLAAATSGVLSDTTATLLWACTGAVLVMVEAIELARAIVRLRLFGWRDGLLVYDVSQWARNFTFGMFYAFTLAFAERFDPHAALHAARLLILRFGPYVVLFFLVAEAGLMLLHFGRGLGCRGNGSATGGLDSI